MAELYDWSKEGLTVTTKHLPSKTFELDVKKVVTPQGEVYHVKGLHSVLKYQSVLGANASSSGKSKFKLVGGIKEAINRAFNNILPPKSIPLSKNTSLIPDEDGRLFFTLDRKKYYINKDKSLCIDELGMIWVIDINKGYLDIYGGIENASNFEFDFMFVNQKAEDNYYNKLEGEVLGDDNPFSYLFTRDEAPTPTTSSKVVDFAAYKKMMEEEGPRGR